MGYYDNPLRQIVTYLRHLPVLSAFGWPRPPAAASQRRESRRMTVKYDWLALPVPANQSLDGQQELAQVKI